ESGSGKTTLGRTLIQLENETSGSITFRGNNVTTLSGEELEAWRRNAQMVFQDPESSLNDRMTIGEIIREPLDVHDWKEPRDRRERVRDLLTRVGLKEEHYYRYPHQFSGGQRQRIGVARALALEPEFVVLDEPVSALDVSVQARVLNLLQDLQDEFDLTYLLIAHDLSVVRFLADRVAVMYLGKLMEIGKTENIFQNPGNPYTISLLSAIPKPDPTAEHEEITLRGTPPSPRYPPSGCPFSSRCPMKIRPEEFKDLDEETWQAIGALREVIRERVHADRSLREIAKHQLGFETRFSTVEEVISDIFEGITLPKEVDDHVNQAVNLLEDDEFREANEYLDEVFNSICDAEMPQYYTIHDSGRESLCHRHAEEYEDPRSLEETHID
ncbi:MAG: ABC transporter ATP-binding protein, partial [Halobacteriaceae archaeon]